MSTLPRSNQTQFSQTLLIEGPEAVAFAHAQFSSDVTALAVGQWQFSAWLDAQGRVMALFHLARLDEQRLLLLLRGGNAASMRDALRRYVFRSRLSLELTAPFVVRGGPAMPLYAVSASDTTIAFGCGSYGMQLLAVDAPSSTNDEIIDVASADDAWPLVQMRDGWPWLPNALLGKLLPPALSLHRLQAVALDKGCYPGQEIVARLHYRGGNKWHLHHIGLSPATAAGTLMQAEATEQVQLLNVLPTRSGAEALAVIHANVDMHDVDARDVDARDGTRLAGAIQGDERTESLRITSLRAWPN